MPILVFDAILSERINIQKKVGGRLGKEKKRKKKGFPFQKPPWRFFSPLHYYFSCSLTWWARAFLFLLFNLSLNSKLPSRKRRKKKGTEGNPRRRKKIKLFLPFSWQIELIFRVDAHEVGNIPWVRFSLCHFFFVFYLFRFYFFFCKIERIKKIKWGLELRDGWMAVSVIFLSNGTLGSWPAPAEPFRSTNEDLLVHDEAILLNEGFTSESGKKNSLQAVTSLV